MGVYACVCGCVCSMALEVRVEVFPLIRSPKKCWAPFNVDVGKSQAHNRAHS